MLSLLYDIFISPLIMGMNFVLVNAYSILNSYGLAIVVLSLVVNTVLLPLYHMADKWQQEEREKQNKMADKVAEIKQAFQGQERFMMLKTLYRQNHYHPIMAVRNSVGFLIQVPFFFAAYQLLSHFPALNGQSFGPFANLGLPDGLLTIGDLHINVMPFVMTGINLLSAFVYTKGLSSKDKIQLYVFAGIFLVLLYTSPVGLVLYWTLNNVYSLGKNLVSAWMSKLPKNNIRIKCTAFDFIPSVSSNRIFNLLSLFIPFLILIYLPVNIYLSDSSSFDISLYVILNKNIIVLILIYFVLLYMYVSLSQWFKGRFTFILLVSLLFVIFNIFISFFDYGFVDNYLLTNSMELGNRKVKLIYDIVIFSFVFFTSYLIVRYGSTKVIFNILIVVFISLLFPSLHGIYKYNDKVLAETKDKNLVPSYTDTLLGFSENKKNIVIIMADMFTSQHLDSIINNDNSLKKRLDGFTWYSNTITAGDSTFLSEASIHGGHKYTPDEINKRSGNIKSIQDEIENGYNVFSDNFGNRNFSISYAGVQYANCINIRNKSKYAIDFCKPLSLDYSYQVDFSEFYADNNKIKLSDDSVDEIKFINAYSLLNIAPYVLKLDVYNGGGWLGAIDTNKFTAKSISNIAAIDSFKYLSNNDKTESTFKYIQISTPHAPWNLDPKTCKPTLLDSYPDTKNNERINGVIPEHYTSEKCTIEKLSEWFDWMKKNNVYDNTMIIIVSDHGHYDNPKLAKAFGVDVSGIKPYSEDINYPGRPSGLLMVKNIDEKGAFKESKQFMSTADVPSIACSIIGGCSGIQNDPRGLNEKRTFNYSMGNWSPSKHKTNEFIIDKMYEVKNDMYNKENWKQIK